MKKTRTILCAVVFGLLYMLTLTAALYFITDTTLLAGQVNWERCEIIGDGGEARPFDADVAVAPPLAEGESFRFTGRLPPLEQAPEVYEPGGYLLMEVSGAMRMTVNGRELFACAIPERGQDHNLEQIRLSIQPEEAGGILVLEYAPDGIPSGIFPPYPRFTSEYRIVRMNTAITHGYAIATGAYILAFLLAAAIFLAGVAAGTPDWSLPALALAESTAAVWLMCSNAGYYYLPEPLYAVLGHPDFVLVPITLMLLYLALNRKRRFWRYLGRITIFAALFGGIVTLLSRRGDRILFKNLASGLENALHGNLNALFNWLLTYLMAACSAIAAYGLLRAQTALQNEKVALSVQKDLAMENYALIQNSVQNTALLRHEWKNNVASLQLLARQGDLEQLRAKLDQMGDVLDRLSVKTYSRHFAIDAILRSAAARAGEQGIRFDAAAPVPEQLAMDITDLCSFLMNLLDNALEAAAHAEPDRREIECSIRYQQGYLAIMCRNTYAGALAVDEEGNLNTTKPGREGSGFGLLNMRSIAKKYKGIFDVSYTDGQFTVHAALKLA